MDEGGRLTETIEESLLGTKSVFRGGNRTMDFLLKSHHRKCRNRKKKRSIRFSGREDTLPLSAPQKHGR